MTDVEGGVKNDGAIRLNELLAMGDCAVCGKKQLEGAIPAFYRVTIARAGFDGAAVRRAAGLELMIGSLASVMGPDEPLAKIIDGPRTVFVHDQCAGRFGHLLTLMDESL